MLFFDFIMIHANYNINRCLIFYMFLITFAFAFTEGEINGSLVIWFNCENMREIKGGGAGSPVRLEPVKEETSVTVERRENKEERRKVYSPYADLKDAQS